MEAPIIILVISILMFVVNIFIGSNVSTFLKPSDISYGKYEPILGTFNGCGGILVEGKRVDFKTFQKVYYNFLSMFNIPLFPIGCYIAQKGVLRNINIKRKQQIYKIYGKVKPNGKEVLSICLNGWCVVGFLISIIWIAIYLFS